MVVDNVLKLSDDKLSTLLKDICEGMSKLQFSWWDIRARPLNKKKEAIFDFVTIKHIIGNQQKSDFTRVSCVSKGNWMKSFSFFCKFRTTLIMFKIAFPNFTKKVFVHLYKKWVIISRGIVLIIESKVAVVPQQLRFMREQKYQCSQLIQTCRA